MGWQGESKHPTWNSGMFLFQLAFWNHILSILWYCSLTISVRTGYAYKFLLSESDLIREFCLKRGDVWMFFLVWVPEPILKKPVRTQSYWMCYLYDGTFLERQSWDHNVLVDGTSPKPPTYQVFKTTLPSFFILWFSEVWMLFSVMKQGTIKQS